MATRFSSSLISLGIPIIIANTISLARTGSQGKKGSIVKTVGSEEAEGVFSSAGANGPLLVCSQVLRITLKLSCTRFPCPAKPSAQVTCNSICLPRSTRRSRRISQSNYIDHGVSYPVVDQMEELAVLPFGKPIGGLPPASRGVSSIIKFYFVSFVLFVVIFLSRYNPLSLC